MNLLSLNIDDDLKIMEDYNLTAEEWWLTQLLFLATYPESNYSYLARYAKICNGISETTLTALQEKGVLKKFKVKKGDNISLENIQFNYIKDENGECYPNIPFSANFLKSLLKHTGEMGKELFMAYPQFSMINGKEVNLKTISAKFGSYQEAFFSYGSKIRFNKETHDAIIKLVSWGAENQLINCSLAKFICDEGWIALQAAQTAGMEKYSGQILI